MTIHISKTEISKIVENLNPKQLNNINQLVLFIGHAHSGHSIIGSILDAHNQIAIANEVNIVKLINEKSLSKKEIASILLYFSLNNNQENSWHNSEYIYKIENSMQGKTLAPFVIGDKKAGGTTRILFNNPKLLDILLEMYGSMLKFIFVKRNPEDIVAAYSYYMKQPPSQFHVNRYNENLETVKTIRQNVPDDQFMMINQESFVKNPLDEIYKLLTFLNIQANENNIEGWVKNVKSNLPGKSSQIKIPNHLLTQLKTI